MFQKTGFPRFFSNEEVILKIVNAFNINKAHGYHDISIWMIKLCSKSVVKPLSMIFNNCMDSFQFNNGLSGGKLFTQFQSIRFQSK